MRIWEAEQAIGVFVIVHGAGEHYGRYTWLIERLNREHFHVIAGDLPGFGRTRGKRGILIILSNTLMRFTIGIKKR
nr:alpha/beta fold hydrolase [Geomicrobium sp. JCM 19038]